VIHIFYSLKDKSYNIPVNAPLSSEHRYLDVINKGYSKYLDSIYQCGNLCMLSQFVDIVKNFEADRGFSENYYYKFSINIIKDLEKLGFISTHYLNRHKYIYLKQPTFALISGNYKVSRRANKRNDLKTEKFFSTIIRMEYLLKYGETFSHEYLDSQLLQITKAALNLIIDSGNTYKHDITTIKRIIELGTYKRIGTIVNNTRENNTRLGIIRFIWKELGKEFWKIGLQGQFISKKPYHFKLNLLPDGRITLHYAPMIMIIDSFYDTDFYKGQSNKFFHMFFNMNGNVTQSIKQEYLLNKDFSYPHFNRVGYTIKVIGSNERQLKEKINILNMPFDGDNQHSPLIAPCDYVCIDIEDYFKYSSNVSSDNKDFETANDNIDKLIKKQL